MIDTEKEVRLYFDKGFIEKFKDLYDKVNCRSLVGFYREDTKNDCFVDINEPFCRFISVLKIKDFMKRLSDYCIAGAVNSESFFYSYVHAIEQLEYLTTIKFNRKDYLEDLRDQWEQVKNGDKYFREQIEQITSGARSHLLRETFENPHFTVLGFYQWYRYGPELVYGGIDTEYDLLKLEKYIYFLAKFFCDRNEKSSWKSIFEVALYSSITLGGNKKEQITETKVKEIRKWVS